MKTHRVLYFVCLLAIGVNLIGCAKTEATAIPATSLVSTQDLVFVATVSPANLDTPLSTQEIDALLLKTGEPSRIGQIGMAVSQFVRLEDRLLVGVCFDQPGSEGWQLGPATLSYDSGSSSSFMGTVTVDTS